MCRREGTRSERRIVSVFTEGEKTEPAYLRALARLLDDNVVLTVDSRHGLDPLDLVHNAVGSRGGREADELWCVFDVEYPQPHERLQEACQLADAKGIKLAISNPCFELWLILHFEDRTAFLDSATAEHRSRELDGRKGKHIDGQIYMPHLPDAIQRAEKLRLRHLGDGSPFPQDNPSSGMPGLISALGLAQESGPPSP